MTLKLNFGEVWLADLSPRVGTELGKTRPVLIVQEQTLLDVGHPSSIIIPLTTNLIDNAEPLRIRLKPQNKLEKESDLLIDQIRAIDNKRLYSGPLTICDNEFMTKVIKSVLDIIGDKSKINYSQ